MTVKFDHLCACGHLAHIDLTKTENGGTVIQWCDQCGATGFKRVRVPGILGAILFLFGQIK